MLPQIAYLFGAGASAQVLPTVKEMPERIKVVRDFIEANYIFEKNETLLIRADIQVNKNECKAYLLEGLDNLYDKAKAYSTIDTYAKKLNILNKSREIEELIFFLALYFNIEQKIVGVDPRYETFLVSILNFSTYKFPDNLKFLTWNYDLQMEAAHELIENSGNDSFSFSLFNTEKRELSQEKFASFKLNGSSNFAGRFDDFLPLVKSLNTKVCRNTDLDFPLGFGYVHTKNRNRVYDGYINLNFAWYKNGDYLNTVSSICELTEVLVVIGYSFPFFNREVDRQIIRKMSKLSKIYIQDCYPENIKSRFLSILPDWEKRGIEIIPVSDVSQFFLPPEL